MSDKKKNILDAGNSFQTNPLERNPDLVFKQKTSRLLRNVNELVDNGFLVVSQDYMDWVEKCKK